MKRDWISVEDRLPKWGETILVTGEAWGWRYKVARMGMLSNNKKVWLDAWNLLEQIFWKEHITHWMSLPAAPENE